MQVKNEIKNTKDKTIKKQNNLPWHGQFTVKKKKYKKNLRRHLKIIGSGRHCIAAQQDTGTPPVDTRRLHTSRNFIRRLNQEQHFVHFFTFIS